MADPGDKAAAKAPSTLGEGCLARYDLQDMSDEAGTDFPGAADLWRQLNPSDDRSADASDPAGDAPAGRRTPVHRQADRSSK